MNPDMEWGAPPVQHRKGRPPSEKWATIADNLKTRPGEWAIVAKDVSPTTAALIRDGRLKAFQNGTWEAVSRGTEGNRAKEIYARYVGPGRKLI
jgi:hypothetical protein